MATITDLEIPADGFALSETLSTVPGASFEGERAVAHDGTVVPFLWATAEEFERLETAFENDPTVAEASALTGGKDERLYRMRWSEKVDEVSELLLDDGTILNARASDGRWQIRVMFLDREALSNSYMTATEEGFPFEIRSIYELDSREKVRFGMTRDQQKTLQVALEKGYYDVPRETSLSVLADHVGISHQALSERFRRGHKNLIESTIGTNHVEDALKGTETPSSPL